MKKVFFILLAAVLTFGIQSETFANTNDDHGVSVKSGKASIKYSQSEQLLRIYVQSPLKKDNILVYVDFKNQSFTKESFIVIGERNEFTMSLDGAPVGPYTVRVFNNSIDIKESFHKRQ